MLMAYSRYWAPLFPLPLTSPKMFGNVLHPDPYSGRVRQRTCQVLIRIICNQMKKMSQQGT